MAKEVYEFFKKPIYIKGKHARMAGELWNQKNIEAGFFQRLIDIYIVAPIIGFRMGRKAESDNSANIDGIMDSRTIFAEQVVKESDKLNYIMQMILMLEYSETMPGREAINLALRAPETLEDYQKMLNLFESYVRGGIEVLHEDLVVRKLNPFDVVQEEKSANYMNLLHGLPNELN